MYKKPEICGKINILTWMEESSFTCISNELIQLTSRWMH